MIAVCIGLLTKRIRIFNPGGAVVIILFAYACWSLGTWIWGLPVILGFITFSLSLILISPDPVFFSKLKVRIVFQALLIPFIWLFLADTFNAHNFFFGPFISTCILMLGIILHQRILFKYSCPGRIYLFCCLLTGFIASTVMVIIPVWIENMPFSSLWVVISICFALHIINMYSYRHFAPNDLTWFRHPLSLLTYSLAGIIMIIMQYFEFIPVWTIH